MRIGDMRIDPLIDGETVSPPTACYVNPADWSGYEEYLDTTTGVHMNTLGGYLIRYDDRVIVVDTGAGPKPVYPVSSGGFRSALYSTGVTPAEVTDVIYSHLHLDHIGWASIDGKPFFPNATYRVDKRDWDYFCSPDYDMPDWEKAASDPSVDAAAVRLAPVADRMEFFEGDQEVLPGIESVEASGHTPGSSVLRLTSDGEQGMLLGDLVHSQPELVKDHWHFFAHLDPEAAMDAIERVRKELVDTKMPFGAAHFPGLRWGRLSTESGGALRYDLIPL
ncbi:MAG: Glyoxylase, beta-lactamase superfamily [Subtercola sp.]|nr:Glyoxylase, beta-lactamase superfamily [Subtercola sp.]